jgi:hypothetical protein
MKLIAQLQHKQHVRLKIENNNFQIEMKEENLRNVKFEVGEEVF